MKVVLICADGSIYGYTGLDNLSPECGQQIPDVVTDGGKTFVLRPRESVPREVLWNCEAVFREAIVAAPATRIYAQRVDGLILRAIGDCNWLAAQPRMVELIDDYKTDRMIDKAEGLLSFEHANPFNAAAWEDLKEAVRKAKFWQHPGRYVFDEDKKVWNRA